MGAGLPPSAMRHELGRNVVVLDGDTVWIEVHEPWTLPLLREVLNLLQQHIEATHPPFLVIQPHFDYPVPAEARRYISKTNIPASFREIIIVSRALLVRAVVQLIYRARSLLGTRVTEPHFVSTADEARRLLVELRQR